MLRAHIIKQPRIIIGCIVSSNRSECNRPTPFYWGYWHLVHSVGSGELLLSRVRPPRIDLDTLYPHLAQLGAMIGIGIEIGKKLVTKKTVGCLTTDWSYAILRYLLYVL